MVGYLTVLRVRGFLGLFAASTIARLAPAMNGFAVLLFAKANTASYSLAGASTGALALGVGISSVLLTRAVDRYGPSLLAPLAVAHAGSLTALVAIPSSPASLVGCALAAGLLFPPVTPVARAYFPRVLAERSELVPRAFALDAVASNVAFILGPLIVTAVATGFSPSAAIILCGCQALFGTILLLTHLTQRQGKPIDALTSRGASIHAWSVPGIWVLIASAFTDGFGYGALVVIFAAVAGTTAQSADAGPLLAWLLITATIGSLFYGSRRWRVPASRRFVWLACLFPLSLLLTAPANSVVAMGVCATATGLLFGPILTTRNELAGRLAPPGADTEAYGLTLTAVTLAIGVGSIVTGAMIGSDGEFAGICLAASISGAAAVVVYLGRMFLEPAASSTSGKQPQDANNQISQSEGLAATTCTAHRLSARSADQMTEPDLC
jgi:MFS family permease